MTAVRRLGAALAPPAVAVLIALALTALLLTVLGVDAGTALRALVDFGGSAQGQANQLRTLLSGAVPLFLAGVAVSVAFRMNLFNIGVEGQYRVATVCAAYVGGELALPMPLHVLVVVLVAMLAGAAYAAVPAVLKVTRGVNEVITTIMLNSIAVGLAAYLVAGPFRDSTAGEGGNPTTRPLGESARLPGFQDSFLLLGLQPPTRPVTGFLVVAVVVGVVVALLVSRTRFGFELRASGANPTAAVASGIPAKAMVLRAMLLSGALAGLVGLPELLSEDYSYGTSFTSGLGFTGIAVALLGRNSVPGIAVAALLFSFLDRAGPSLETQGIPPSVSTIIQGTVVLTVVVVNEVAARLLARREDRRVRGRTEPAAVPAAAAQQGEGRA